MQLLQDDVDVLCVLRADLPVGSQEGRVRTTRQNDSMLNIGVAADTIRVEMLKMKSTSAKVQYP